MSAQRIVQALTEFATDCAAEYDQIPEPDVETQAIVLCAIRDTRADLAALAAQVERDLMANAGKRSFVVEGVGEVVIRKSTKRSQWDHEGLTRRVVALALDERQIIDESTGEYEPAHEAVARVLSECARPAWRVTPLRARGLQVDEFCSETDGGWSVQLPPRSET